MLYSKLDHLDPVVENKKARIDRDRDHFDNVIELRLEDPEIQHLTFLFDSYECEFW